MIVLDDILCKKCNYTCNAKHFQQNFGNWTSGNNDIDKFIQNTQLLVHHNSEEKALEWIPYDRFYNIKYIVEDEFGQAFRANWIDGIIDRWDNFNKNWKRKDCNMFVVLKILNNSKNITLEFINKVY
jgi:hypothetical protein